MNRGLMRTLLQVRSRGTPVENYIADHLDTHLNLAAQQVAIMLADNERINYGRAIYTISTTTAADYPLLGVSNLHSIRDLQGGAANYGGRAITESERGHKLAQYKNGRDEDGKYLYYVTYSPNDQFLLTITATGGTYTITYDGVTSAAIAYNDNAAAIQAHLEDMSNIDPGDVTVSGTGPYTIVFGGNLGNIDITDMTIATGSLTGGTATLQPYRYTLNFLAAPGASLSFTVCYNVLVPEIPSGTTYDTRSYSVVPPQFHELIVENALTMLIGHTGAPATAFAASAMSQLAGAAANDSAKRINPYRPNS